MSSSLNAGSKESAADEGIPLKREQSLILIMDTPKGDVLDVTTCRGVFASKQLPARTVLEVSPVIVLDPMENEEHIKKTQLYNYTYNWPYATPAQSDSSNPSRASSITTQAVVLGLGSMFNHSTLHQNVGWERDLKNLLITYTTLREIMKGEELCISYGPRLTFKDTDAEELNDGPEDWTEVMNIIEFID